MDLKGQRQSYNVVDLRGGPPDTMGRLFDNLGGEYDGELASMRDLVKQMSGLGPTIRFGVDEEVKADATTAISKMVMRSLGVSQEEAISIVKVVGIDNIMDAINSKGE